MSTYNYWFVIALDFFLFDMLEFPDTWHCVLLLFFCKFNQRSPLFALPACICTVTQVYLSFILV